MRTISPNFDTNSIICRKFEKFKKKIPKNKILWREIESLLKYSGMF